ncbi:MAG: FHA domain-containing protein [Solirubrobacteraceae bacterium]
MADAPAASRAGQLVLVLPDGGRVPIEDRLTIGRADDATIRLSDQTVSRQHARIVPGPEGPRIEDAGSRFGVLIDGVPLTGSRRLEAGVELRLGNVVLRVERNAPLLAGGPPAASEPSATANATIVVPIGATPDGLRAADDGQVRPRLRSGWALKRVEDGRYVLRDLRSKTFMRLDEPDARLLSLLDGRRTIAELLVQATTLFGPAGPGRLARVIAECGDRGLLDGIAATPTVPVEPSPLRRALEPRERTFEWVPDWFVRVYAVWGRLWFSPLAATGLVLLSLAGLVTFSYLIGARYGTPLVVAHRLLLGGLVFIAGRSLLVALHETAHGLALAHYGRRTDRAGLRLIMLFPYAFVDTSEAYFEPRSHRIVISAAGPLSDFACGAAFAIACALSPKGNLRDVLFQLAFAGYVGAFFNANPFLDRDGYQILGDWLGESRLRERARAQLSARLSGRTTKGEGSSVLGRYAVAGLVWSLIGAGFVVVLSLRYYDRLSALAPHGLVVAGFAGFFVLLLLPVAFALGMPLLRRARFGTTEVNRVIR